MRILHVDETFHPLFGYHCNPLAKFQSMMGEEIYIIAPEAKHIHPVYHGFGEYGENQEQEDREYTRNTHVQIIRVPGKGYISGRLNYDMRAMYQAIETINPDVIMVHCIETLTAMRLLLTLRNKYPMVFDSHMLSMATRNPFYKIYDFIYKNLFARVIKKEKYTVIITQNDDYVITHLGIPKEQTVFVSFGTDTELFCPNKESRRKFIEDNNFPEDSFIIVSTGKLSEPKDGKLFARSVRQKFATDRKVVVIVVADFSGEYEKEVKKILDESENQVIYYDVQRYTDLPWFYQVADVTIFPKQCSMSFYDAQSCGLPVISEKGHVNEERNSHGNGLCFEPGDCDDLRRKIETIINLSDNEYSNMQKRCRSFVKENYSYTKIALQYMELMEKEVQRFKCKHKYIN